MTSHLYCNLDSLSYITIYLFFFKLWGKVYSIMGSQVLDTHLATAPLVGWKADRTKNSTAVALIQLRI